MGIKEFVTKEREALEREKTRDNTLEALMQELDAYPSIKRRIKDAYYTVVRGKDKIVHLRHDIRHFIHRGRHGWATPDTWSMDYSLAKLLDGLFTEFLRVNIAYMDGMTFEEWEAILTEIRDGFRAYHEHETADWTGEFDKLPIEEYIEVKQASFDAAFTKLQRSLALMSEYYPGLWW